MEQRIVCAANKLYNGRIIIGARHWDEFMHQQMEDILQNHPNVLRKDIEVYLIDGEEQGFINQWGTFLTRGEAWEIARKNGQVVQLVGNQKSIDEPGHDLYSENLY